MQVHAHETQRTLNEIERIAEGKLALYSILETPVNPVEIAEIAGADVYYANFGNPDVSGLIRKDGERISIFVKNADTDVRQRFTVAHELGHLFLHLEGQAGNFVDMYRTVAHTNQHEPVEVEANQFAAALLMPRKHVQKELRFADSVEDLAIAFGVSVQAMTIRLRHLKLLDE